MPRDLGMRKPTASARSFPRGKERRKSKRQKYTLIARIALCSQNELPEQLPFREVRCRNISFGGVAFYLDEKLSCETIAIEMATRPRTLRMLARVVYQLPAELFHLFDDQAEHPGEFVVGCQFLRRLS